MYNILIILTLLATLISCSSQLEKPNPEPIHKSENPTIYKLGHPIKVKNDSAVLMYPTEFNDLPGWSAENHLQAFHSFKKSCESWSRQPDHKPLSGIFDLGKVGDWKKICHAHVKHGQEKQFFEHWFVPYAIANNGNFDGLFTGYYVPELHGSFHKSARYNVPIYGIPKDLIKRGNETGRIHQGRFVPYHDRSAISGGALSGKGAELLWVDSELDAFFLEVQGSGRVVMDNGHVQGLGYAGKNGREYYAIGKSLVDRGIISREEISMQSIRNWILANPDEGKALMLENASYVFFKLTHAKPDEGPIGSMNTPLTPKHSLAVDKNFLPLGIPLWLDADHPSSDEPLRHLVMAQDTGGAIKGLIRGDFFWGQGLEAGESAGIMKSRGRYFLLIPKHLKMG